MTSTRPLDSSAVQAGLTTAVAKIEMLRDELMEATRAFLVKQRVTEAVRSPNEDEKLLADVSTVFRNAVKRTQASWRLSIAMTVISFALIIGMISTAVLLAVITGKSHWAMIFGGLGVSTVVGTLLWRPFDRVFRATIMTQQIEMIHVQMVAAFRGSTTLQQRLTVCREAVESLKAIFSTAADTVEQTASRRGSPTVPRRRKGKDATE